MGRKRWFGTEYGLKLCVACGEPVQDESQEYCDLCLDDNTLDIGENLRASENVPRVRHSVRSTFVSRYDAL